MRARTRKTSSFRFSAVFAMLVSFGLVLIGSVYCAGPLMARVDDNAAEIKCRALIDEANHEVGEMARRFGRGVPEEAMLEWRLAVDNQDRAAEQCMQLAEGVESPAVRASMIWMAYETRYWRAVEDADYDLAYEIILEGSDAVRELTGFYSQEFADTLMLRADVHIQRGNQAESLNILKDELKILQHLHGEDSPKTIPALRHLAVFSAPDAEQRDRYYREALALAEKAQDEDRQIVVNLIRGYSGFMMYNGDYDKAMDLLDKFDIPVESE